MYLDFANFYLGAYACRLESKIREKDKLETVMPVFINMQATKQCGRTEREMVAIKTPQKATSTFELNLFFQYFG